MKLETSCLSGYLAIYLDWFTTKTAHYSLRRFKGKKYAYLNLRLKGLDKVDKTHFELWISFHLTEIRNLQHSPFEGFSNFSLVVKTGTESGRKLKWLSDEEFKNWNLERLTFSLFRKKQTNIHVVHWLLNFGHNIFTKKKKQIHCINRGKLGQDQL